MTNEQKTAIRKMRLQGLGYRATAATLGLKVHNVEEYCKSHGLAGDGALVKLNYPIWCQQNNRCMVCGDKLQQPKTGRRKRFCSGRCRSRYCLMKKSMEE